MALYSNYPIDSTRHMHIYSKHRNRIQYPYATDFEIPLPNKREVKEENTGVNSIDPIYDGYPLEFGYFGSSSNDATNYPNGLQLSESASSSSNFYSRLIVQDETVYPRDYATIISYDSTTNTTGYSKSAIISGWVKGSLNTGNPGSLYSIRKSLPIAQGSCWVMPNPSQVNLVNTGIINININVPRINLNSFETDYNTDIDYVSVPIFPVTGDPENGNVAMPVYGPCMVGVTNKKTGMMTNSLVSGYKNGNLIKWKPNTQFFIGNILYIVVGTETRYYVVIQNGTTGDVEPTSVSLNTIIDDPLLVVASGVKYVYKGTSIPVRKKWLPETHYNVGDIIGTFGTTYAVTGTSGLGLTGPGSFLPLYLGKEIPRVSYDGDLVLSWMIWSSTDPGFGCSLPFKKKADITTTTFLSGIPISSTWTPNTYMIEGTFIQPIGLDTNQYGNPYIFCVYKAGVSGNTPPLIPDNLYYASWGAVIQDGTAYLLIRVINYYSFYAYPYLSALSGNILPSFGETVYEGKVFVLNDGRQAGANQISCIQTGTMGGWWDLVYDDVTDTYTFTGGTAIYSKLTHYPFQENNLANPIYPNIVMVPTPRAPYTLNPRPWTNSQRYPVIPWSANSSFSTGEYLYYGTLTFDVIQGGITGDTPPTDTYKQTNGSVVLFKVSYTDPYKGCLLKITQVEDNDNQFKPYYARISYYNPNTNIVYLESPLPITEKRCLYEILQFSSDNYNPLEYTVNPFFGNISSPVIFYDITLISITLPNLPVYSSNSINVLTSSQPQPFDSYPKLSSLPYIIVVLKNVNSLEQAIPVCSNNPNEYSATFRIPVSDANPNLTSLYTRLSSGDTKTMRYNPNNNLRLTITDPQGNVLLFANPSFFEDFINFVSSNIPYPDTIRYITGNIDGFGLGWVMGDLLPIPPSSSNQVSATFAIKPHM